MNNSANQGQLFSIDPLALHPHPRNTEFFDDIQGGKWEDFKASIQSGIKNPLLIDQDDMIISGHQRWRAACELGLDSVPVIRYEYLNEDSRLLDMIALNVQQRFAGQSSDIKTARCAKELERICGTKRGRPSSDEKVEQCSTFSGLEVGDALSQEEIAEMFGKSPRVLRNLCKLLELIPELQDAVEGGTIPISAASRLLSRLDQDSQQELFTELGPEVLGKIPMSELQAFIPQIKALNEQLEALQEEVKRSSSRGVFSESELDEMTQKAETLLQEKRDMYEKYQAANKQHTQEIKNLKENLKREKDSIIRLQLHYSELKRFKDATREMSKLNREDLIQLEVDLQTVEESVQGLLQEIREVG